MRGAEPDRPAEEKAKAWPSLSTPGWQDSARTLHMWTQIVGKARLALAPMTNHWWQVPLYVTARGLSTSTIPYGWRVFEVELDLRANRLELRASDGTADGFSLEAKTLAGFHARFFEALQRIGVDIRIHPLATEIEDTIFLDRDQQARRYDPDWGTRFHTVLVQTDRLLKEFRGSFIGKASPVHFFWGSFDMAVTRFSGRRAPRHPGGVPHCSDAVLCEAYSHEVSSAGFWSGDQGYPEAIFYSYAYPQPEGYTKAQVLPRGAHYDPLLKEFVLPYELIRTAPDPDLEVRTFLETTYAAAAELGRWNRAELERQGEERKWTAPVSSSYSAPTTETRPDANSSSMSRLP